LKRLWVRHGRRAGQSEVETGPWVARTDVCFSGQGEKLSMSMEFSHGFAPGRIRNGAKAERQSRFLSRWGPGAAGFEGSAFAEGNGGAGRLSSNGGRGRDNGAGLLFPAEAELRDPRNRFEGSVCREDHHGGGGLRGPVSRRRGREKGGSAPGVKSSVVGPVRSARQPSTPLPPATMGPPPPLSPRKEPGERRGRLRRPRRSGQAAGRNMRGGGPPSEARTLRKTGTRSRSGVGRGECPSTGAATLRRPG